MVILQYRYLTQSVLGRIWSRSENRGDVDSSCASFVLMIVEMQSDPGNGERGCGYEWFQTISTSTLETDTPT